MKCLVILLVVALVTLGSASAEERMERSSRHVRRQAVHELAARQGGKNAKFANAKGGNAKAAKANAKTAKANAKGANAKNANAKGANAKNANAKAANAKNAGNNSKNNNNNNNNNANSLDTSLTLDNSVIQTGSAQNGNPTGGQVASLTSVNNFINFCVTSNNGAPLLNGTQTKSKAACNPIPMGMIIGQNNIPVGKFTNPKNLDVIKANQSFNITMKIQNLETGNFVNPQTNFFSAPAQLNSKGVLIGHSHFVIEAVDSLTSTTVTNPLQFAFFKGVDPPAVNGVMTVAVTGGLPAGTFRMGSLHSAANHQPPLLSIAQHGMVDDVVYFSSK